MGYIGDGPKPELEVGDISTKDVTATGDLTVDTNTLFVDASEDKVGVGTTTVTDAGVTITPSVTRVNSWDAKLALQSTGASDFPALLFSGAAATTRYGGIVSTTDITGNTPANETAEINFLLSSSTAGNIVFRTNRNIGTTTTGERMRIDSVGSIGLIGASFGLISNGGQTTTTLADDASINLAVAGTATAGGGLLCVYEPASGDNAIYHVGYNRANVVSNSGSSTFTTGDTDGKNCVIVSGHTITFKNRTGSSRGYVFNLFIAGGSSFNQ